MNYIHIKEYESFIFSINHEEDFNLSAKILKYVRIKEYRKDYVMLQAQSYIGYIPLYKDYVLVVEPKIYFNDLLRILFIADENIQYLSYDLLQKINKPNCKNMYDLMLYSFIEKIELIKRDGLLKTTNEKIHNFSNIRGKILLKENMLYNNIRKRIEFAYCKSFDITENNLINQAIKFTIWRILNLNILPEEAYQKLINFYRFMGKVDLNYTSQHENYLKEALYGRLIPSTRRYYKDVIALCLFLLSEYICFDNDMNLKLQTFLIDMNIVFENYIRNALVREFLLSNSDLTIINGNIEAKPLFDNTNLYSITPDILVKRSGKVCLVMDTKYKPKIGREDLWQIISYTVSYGVDAGVLIYPNINNLQPIETFQINNKKIYIFRFDLSKLDKEESRLKDFTIKLINQ